ncbi:MAG: hypothetical protein EBU66_12060 [Bacteroidetes bacterium]|nr:hypothetical protein [bacterium]NBP65377.1 hypothetical protein [Bacteroidota bacterium]
MLFWSLNNKSPLYVHSSTSIPSSSTSTSTSSSSSSSTSTSSSSSSSSSTHWKAVLGRFTGRSSGLSG